MTRITVRKSRMTGHWIVDTAGIRTGFKQWASALSHALDIAEEFKKQRQRARARMERM